MCGCAEWLESRTCDQQVGGSNPDRCTAECNPGQVVYMRTPLLLSSTIWYPLAGEVTAGLAECNGSLLPGLWLRSPAGPGSAPELYAQFEFGTTLPLPNSTIL